MTDAERIDMLIERVARVEAEVMMLKKNGMDEDTQACLDKMREFLRKGTIQ